jgi:hypothetical protein
MIINLPQNARPLCPNNINGDNILHRLHVELTDEAIKFMTKNKDEEFINEESERIYLALAYGRFDGRMNLYKEINTVYKPKMQTIETWYYRCNICQLVLPATQAGNF